VPGLSCSKVKIAQQNKSKQTKLKTQLGNQQNFKTVKRNDS
jgi:hypothetical protein